MLYYNINTLFVNIDYFKLVFSYIHNLNNKTISKYKHIYIYIYIYIYI